MKRIFSGVQPTNNIHIGNYLGAIKNWVELQKDYECIFCVVDLHAITVYQKPETLRQNILDIAKTYIALGVDPRHTIIFVQSDVKEHAELAWILNSIAKIGEMERMTQFKDKAKQHKENINMGLFDYPVLMASDILLYDTEAVPVGEDQKQHLELTRDLAMRFNKLYGDTFTVPKPIIKKEGARILGLDDPDKKMSKSSPSAMNYVSLLDAPEIAAKKIMKAVTDSGSEVKSGKDKPALTNLLTIYSLMTGRSVKEIEIEYAGKGYGDFKKGLAEIVSDFLADFQRKFNATNDNEIRELLSVNANKARVLAEKKMDQVKRKIGLK
ncbi:tryptophan--tRNA ligase [Patescibacteria group bacterium]|nr:tryptophan--tRNA ligase [Patescibacteria group bacterium]MBU1613341.1 tryptophan--tRNA ligase [Patescibacteria group bacterium]